MSVIFNRGQQLGREGLNIFLDSTRGWTFQVWTEKGFEDVTRYTT